MPPTRFNAVKLVDYPNTLKALKAKYHSAELLVPRKDAFIELLNKVRADVDLPSINLDELVLATLSRVEEKLSAQVTQARPAVTEESEEDTEASQKKEVDSTH